MGIGFETDVAIIALDGQVRREADCVVAKWRDLPDYYGGNLLVFDQSPGESDVGSWSDRFSTAFSDAPSVKPMTLAWHGGRGALDCFLREGFVEDTTQVHLASKLRRPPRAHARATVRPVLTNHDWHLAEQVQLTIAEPAQIDFMRRRQARWRVMAEAGHGRWFGAYLGETMAACLGLYVVGKHVRFQSVVTHPQFRGVGIARRLVFEAGQWALENTATEQAVIASDLNSSAARVYEDCGLEVVGLEHAVMRFPGAGRK